MDEICHMSRYGYQSSLKDCQGVWPFDDETPVKSANHPEWQVCQPLSKYHFYHLLLWINHLKILTTSCILVYPTEDFFYNFNFYLNWSLFGLINFINSVLTKCSKTYLLQNWAVEIKKWQNFLELIFYFRIIARKREQEPCQHIRNKSLWLEWHICIYIYIHIYIYIYIYIYDAQCLGRYDWIKMKCKINNFKPRCSINFNSFVSNSWKHSFASANNFCSRHLQASMVVLYTTSHGRKVRAKGGLNSRRAYREIDCNVKKSSWNGPGDFSEWSWTLTKNVSSTNMMGKNKTMEKLYFGYLVIQCGLWGWQQRVFLSFTDKSGTRWPDH